MCSYTFDVAATETELPVSKPSRMVIPSHVAFGSEKDVFALLWESGRVEIYDLHTRIGPGRGKVMEPEKLWTGNVGHEVASDTTLSFSQIVILGVGSAATAEERIGHIRIAVLAADMAKATPDVVRILTIRSDRQVDAFEVGLPSRNGRLLSSNEQVIWQAPLGDIFQSMSHSTSGTSNTLTSTSSPRSTEPQSGPEVLFP